ncbi:hypothetical protein B0H12DRAFT_1126978 [Mycena haematopus]|nr:hypothetical protein B0H12DRAFT_1162602 [Mycena haematopus]KAJ7246151.1 hypothetical protein B0H12DRAFT_1126978 [Mycena haematopus]
MECRYWAFMESHPAHVALPFGARQEAMDVLTWAWTDGVLPRPEALRPPPLTHHECQELLALLRSCADAPQTDTDIQGTSLTHIVSRILLRVAQWRQHQLALSLDHTGDDHLRPAGLPHRAADVALSCLLLGFPYLFYTPARNHNRDAEGGTDARTLFPILVVTVCTCLLAAALLEASVTFLALPGLQSIPHAIALTVVLLDVAAIVSCVVAIFWCKAELANAEAPMNGEGLILISMRSVITSLPPVLLIYAVLGFAAAVLLYSFPGLRF